MSPQDQALQFNEDTKKKGMMEGSWRD